MSDMSQMIASEIDLEAFYLGFLGEIDESPANGGKDSVYRCTSQILELLLEPLIINEFQIVPDLYAISLLACFDIVYAEHHAKGCFNILNRIRFVRFSDLYAIGFNYIFHGNPRSVLVIFRANFIELVVSYDFCENQQFCK